MSARTACAVGLLWLASLAAVGVVARAQAQDVAPGGWPIVVSGSDIGFRIEGMQGKTPSGTLVIRVNGQWVEPTTTKKVLPITR